MLDRAEIARRIPHQGSMCLLERVQHWDAEGIVCSADSHRNADNPLRSNGRLGGVCGIEYAAQAMAVHGALLASSDCRPRAGFLVSVRGVEVHVARLDDIPETLTVSATRLMGDENNILYEFRVSAAERLLLQGRAAVIANAEALTSTREPL
jgi:predicted hotdog family 3-hydroxylacyl-ACP dehydratase